MKLKSSLQVIIDSQPLTVAILAALLFGESIGEIGVGGLVLGVIGLLLLEVCLLSMRILTFRMQCRVYQSWGPDIDYDNKLHR